MKILITTGIYPPYVGGPSYYAKSLIDEYLKEGHKVKLLSYKIEKKLPSILRHVLFFSRVLFGQIGTDFIIALDTFSTGVPSVLASKILNKKIIVRVGGDFLWETYVNRTNEKVFLSKFYTSSFKNKLSLKEKIIFLFTKALFKLADAVVFSTDWQRKIFIPPYNIDVKKTFVIENYYGPKIESHKPNKKIFIWAGRAIPVKNTSVLKDVFSDINKEYSDIELDMNYNLPRHKLIEKLKTSYAVVLPSVSEVSPNLLLESIMVNKPFISTKDNGLYDRIKDLGIFINPLSKEDLKQAVLLLSKENKYNDILKKLEQFKFTHSYKQIADEFLDVYKKI